LLFFFSRCGIEASKRSSPSFSPCVTAAACAGATNGDGKPTKEERLRFLKGNLGLVGAGKPNDDGKVVDGVVFDGKVDISVGAA
jgi:hypothetical protein